MANARALDICLEGGKVSLEDLRHHTRPNPCMLILKGARACWDVRRSLPAKGTATQCPEGFQMPGEWSSRAWARNEQKEHEAMVPRWCICLRYVPLARAPSVGSTAGLPQENCTSDQPSLHLRIADCNLAGFGGIVRSKSLAKYGRLCSMNHVPPTPTSCDLQQACCVRVCTVSGLQSFAGFVRCGEVGGDSLSRFESRNLRTQPSTRLRVILFKELISLWATISPITG